MNAPGCRMVRRSEKQCPASTFWTLTQTPRPPSRGPTQLWRASSSASSSHSILLLNLVTVALREEGIARLV